MDKLQQQINDLKLKRKELVKLNGPQNDEVWAVEAEIEQLQDPMDYVCQCPSCKGEV